MRTIILISISLFSFFRVNAQISQGVITYERTINLYKTFNNSNVKEWLKESEKYRKDEFQLHFNDTMSVFFVSRETEVNTWTATCNTVTNFFNQNKTNSTIFFSSEEIAVQDSLIQRKWKITNKWRKIADYDCRQAVFQYDDTTRIYAWFTSAVIPSVGPESYCDLPGAILGLATEDGRITYFAKSVVSTPFDFINTKQKFQSKKAKTREEYIEKFSKAEKLEKEINKIRKVIYLW